MHDFSAIYAVFSVFYFIRAVLAIRYYYLSGDISFGNTEYANEPLISFPMAP